MPYTICIYNFHILLICTLTICAICLSSEHHYCMGHTWDSAKDGLVDPSVCAAACVGSCAAFLPHSQRRKRCTASIPSPLPSWRSRMPSERLPCSPNGPKPTCNWYVSCSMLNSTGTCKSDKLVQQHSHALLLWRHPCYEDHVNLQISGCDGAKRKEKRGRGRRELNLGPGAAGIGVLPCGAL